MMNFDTPSLSRPIRRLCAVALILVGPLAQAGGKLVDGFGVVQVQGGGVVFGPDILTGSRDLLAIGPPAPDAVRVEGGRLWVDTQTTRVLMRYTTVAPGTLHNFALDEVDTHGDWVLTYRSTQPAALTLAWTAEPVPGFTTSDIFEGVLAPSPEFVTLNLGTLVAPEFPLYRTRNFSVQLEFDPVPGTFELDNLTIAGAVPEPTSAMLWMAGLAAMAGLSRRAARTARTA